jgi:hypothetical protein
MATYDLKWLKWWARPNSTPTVVRSQKVVFPPLGEYRRLQRTARGAGWKTWLQITIDRRELERFLGVVIITYEVAETIQRQIILLSISNLQIRQTTPSNHHPAPQH